MLARIFARSSFPFMVSSNSSSLPSTGVKALFSTTSLRSRANRVLHLISMKTIGSKSSVRINTELALMPLLFKVPLQMAPSLASVPLPFTVPLLVPFFELALMPLPFTVASPAPPSGLSVAQSPSTVPLLIPFLDTSLIPLLSTAPLLLAPSCSSLRICLSALMCVPSSSIFFSVSMVSIGSTFSVKTWPSGHLTVIGILKISSVSDDPSCRPKSCILAPPAISLSSNFNTWRDIAMPVTCSTLSFTVSVVSAGLA
mmetsp:Transcript_13395/g.21074  ORF Transcript_13395/g.21074 Transcript_13395/m.21074 type:complete len:256 (+) Transcript_13395:498-1265(+)